MKCRQVVNAEVHQPEWKVMQPNFSSGEGDHGLGHGRSRHKKRDKASPLEIPTCGRQIGDELLKQVRKYKPTETKEESI